MGRGGFPAGWRGSRSPGTHIAWLRLLRWGADVIRRAHDFQSVLARVFLQHRFPGCHRGILGYCLEPLQGRIPYPCGIEEQSTCTV
jgi:hypothetical protein